MHFPSIASLVSRLLLPSFFPSLSMLSSPSGSSDSEDSRSKREGERRREDEDSERARQQQQQQQQQELPIASWASAPQPRPPSSLPLSDAEAAAAGAALKRLRATARARRKGSLLSSSSAPRAHTAVPGSRPPPPSSQQQPPQPRLLDPSSATSDADAAARLRAWLASTLSRPGAARSGAYARHRTAVVRKALALLETRRSEAQDSELQALLGGLSL